MPWMDWMALKHVVFVHVPVAVAFLLPWALVASQRSGRGMRPWWVTCRYLGWAGVLFSILAALSGFLLARRINFLAPGQFLAPVGSGDAAIFRLHQACAVASLLLGALTLKALFRRREDHQSLGILALVLGLLWAGVTLVAGYFGGQLRQSRDQVAAEAPVIERAPAPAPPPTQESAPSPRILDYQRLEPLHAEPVRNALHGNRWIRAWVTPGAQEAYRASQKLPENALVVMSSAEDRWGRPGPDAGPLYALEMKNGKPRFTFYWPRVPESKRGEVGGEAQAFWQGEDSRLGACIACHSEGLAPAKDRSTWTGLRRPKAEEPLHIN